MITRRGILGGLGLGGLGLGALAGVLAPIRALRADGGSDRYLVVYWAKGGWDPSYVFDPHFGSPTVEGDSFAEADSKGGIAFANAITRPAVQSFLEAWGSRSVVINGVTVGSISHVACTQLMLTGLRSESAADVASLVAVGTGGDLALPNLILSGPRFPGKYGATSIPLSATLLGTARGTAPVAPYNAGDETAVRAWLTEQAGSMAFPNSAHLGVEYAAGLQRRALLEAVASSFPTPAGNEEADLLAAGISALTLGLSRAFMMEGSFPQRSHWDSHQDNQANQDACFQHTFTQLTNLMAALSAASAPNGGTLADKTTVLVLSEMGRTPVRNATGGKDHWPFTSAMMIGEGISGGRVLGVSDEALVGQTVDLDTGEASESGARVTPAGMFAGLLESFDLDPSDALPGIAPFRAPWV